MNLRQHLLDAAVPTVFGLLVSLLIFVASDFRVPRIISNLGTDLGMRIFAEPGLAPQRDFFRADAPFVFLDIDYSACQRLRSPDQPISICENPARPPVQILDRLIEVASQARAVILDFQLPERGQVDEVRLKEFNNRLNSEDGPIVIAPAPLRPLPKPLHLQLTGELGLDTISRNGRLRLAAFVAWEDISVGDGVVRDYAPVVFVDEGVQAGRLSYLPTAPFLAAMLSDAPDEPVETAIALADGLFYGGEDPCRADPAWVNLWSQRAGVKLDDLCNNVPLQLSENRRERIMFSINSLAAEHAMAIPTDADTLSTRDVYYGSGKVEGGMLYRHYLLSDFFPNRDVDGWTRMTDALDLSGQVVVIGTSSIAGYDWHSTPLGQMSGAEVIINATRAYENFANRNQTSPLTVRMASVVLQIIVTLAVGLLVALSSDRLKSVVRKPLWRDIWGGLVALGVFLISLALSLALAGYATYLTYSWQPDTVVLDFLTPVLSVFFVNFVILSAAVLVVIRHGLDACFPARTRPENVTRSTSGTQETGQAARTSFSKERDLE